MDKTITEQVRPSNGPIKGTLGKLWTKNLELHSVVKERAKKGNSRNHQLSSTFFTV